MHITQTDYIIDIRFMHLWCQRIAQKDNKVDLIVFDLCTDLLFSPEMTGQIFMEPLRSDVLSFLLHKDRFC